MIYKNLLILGASGKIGKLVLNEAIERGYNVTVIVRSKSKIKENGNVQLIEGSVLDDNVLTEAMKGQDAVVSCLGVLRENQANPWSKVVPPANLTELVADKTLNLMSEFGVKRLISISAAGVGDSEKILTFPMKTLIKLSNVKVSFADLFNMEATMKNSSIDTLALRPVGLKDGDPSNTAKIVDKCGMSSQISRSDVAIWMLDALERKEIYTNSTEIIGV